MAAAALLLNAAAFPGRSWGALSAPDGKKEKMDRLGVLSEQGDLRARLELARLYLESDDALEDRGEAARLLRSVAVNKEGDAEAALEALMLLGDMRAAIRGEYPEISNAAIEQAHHSTGLALLKAGYDVIAREVLIREAFLLSSPALLMLRTLYFGPPEAVQDHDPNVLKLFEQLAAEGVPRAQEIYGEICLAGAGIEKDEAKGISLLEASGTGEASMELARFYFDRDSEKAVKHLEKAAALNIPQACYNLGVFAQSQKTYDMALEFFNKALKLDPDYHEARLELGRMFMEGWGVEKDEGQGFCLIKQVCEEAAPGRLKAVAETNLGVFYLNGTGVEKDLEKARFYLQKAADAGIEKARELLKKIERSGERSQ
jgi:TPR repeat protein